MTQNMQTLNYWGKVDKDHSIEVASLRFPFTLFYLWKYEGYLHFTILVDKKLQGTGQYQNMWK